MSLYTVTTVSPFCLFILEPTQKCHLLAQTAFICYFNVVSYPLIRTFCGEMPGTDMHAPVLVLFSLT